MDTLYQEYLRVIGRIKDIHKLDVYPDHKDVHTFSKDKLPLFKLMFGTFSKTGETDIVVSFQAELDTVSSITLFLAIEAVYPQIKLVDSYMDDDRGEFFLGEDAIKIKQVKQEQRILEYYLENYEDGDIKEFIKTKILGRERDHKKSYDSFTQIDQAIKEFNKMKSGIDDDEVH